MKKRFLSIKSQLIISFIVVVLDQVSKYMARVHLKEGFVETLIPKVIQLRLVKNTGAAFSLFTDSTSILSLLSLSVAIGLIFWILRSGPLPNWQGWAISYLLGGTVGNGIDRWRMGYVTDFLEIIPFRFPIFNIADIAINIAVTCLLIDTLYKSKDLTS